MHVHIAGGDARQLQRLAQRLEQFQAARIEAAGQSSTPIHKRPAKRSRSQRPSFMRRQRRPGPPRQPDDQASIERVSRSVRASA
jgi:hypothetical protein